MNIPQNPTYTKNSNKPDWDSTMTLTISLWLKTSTAPWKDKNFSQSGEKIYKR